MERNKLRYRCRRGMKELDVVLIRYLERHYDAASPAEQRVFAQLLDLQDPQLYGLIVGREAPADPVQADVVRKIGAAVSA
jgi:antitoxin CptB